MMKTLTLFLAFCIPHFVYSQVWTPEQQEIITVIEGCWDSWAEASGQNNFQIYMDDCGTPESRFWWSEISVPRVVEDSRRIMAKGLDTWSEKRGDWLEMRPIHIRIINDMALIYYAPTYQSEDHQGKVTFYNQRRLEVMQKIENTWRFIGGMAVPVATN